MSLSSEQIEMVELFMASYTPEDVSLVDGCKNYESTHQTHISYNAQMCGALPNTWARKTYTERCYWWLLILKKRGVQMKKVSQ
jgi:hypothetical protein